MDDPVRRVVPTGVFGPGLHGPAGRVVDAVAYDGYIGRWSRLFVPALLAAAEIGHGDRVLDVATGTGEASMHAASIVGSTGSVIGADVAPAMLAVARARLTGATFAPVTADGQALPFGADSFDAVV